MYQVCAEMNATPVARQAADCVLTLPSYHGLALDDARTIAQNILELVRA